MAEINIEKKNKNNKDNKNKIGLYIIIAILVIAFIVWWYTALNEDDHDAEIIRPTVMEQVIPATPGAVTFEDRTA